MLTSSANNVITLKAAISQRECCGMSGETELAFDELSAVFGYDSETGKIWWRVRPGKNVYAGTEAGVVKETRKGKDGQPVRYRYVRYRGYVMQAARLAWLLAHGEWPTGRVGFNDGDTLNVSKANLYQQNSVHDVGEPRSAYMKAHREQFPNDWRETHLQKKFGIGNADYIRMAIAQGNRCAICGAEETATRKGETKCLAVDHDHTTGRLRQLLCSDCNVGLGKLGDDPVRLRAAADYIERHRASEDHTMDEHKEAS